MKRTEFTLDRRGVPFALAAAALFGLSTPFAKMLIGSARPQLIAGLLYLGSGVGLGLYWVLTRSQRSENETPLARKDLPWLAGAIMAGGIIAPLLLMLGLFRTRASGASLLLNLEGVFTALLAWFAFRENFDRRIALGMLAILAGAALLSWQGEFRLGGAVGPLLVAGACFAWGVDNNLTQKALLAAAALMGVGVWLHVSERHVHEHAHGTTAHDHEHVHDEHHQHSHGPHDPAVADPLRHRHSHEHPRLVHTHAHYPDIHHRHDHET